VHPVTGKMVKVRADLDETFARVLQTFGWNGVELEIRN
jgi:hypothetical protein